MLSFWIACVFMVGSIVLDQWIYLYIPLITKLFPGVFLFHV